jgi:PAS domain-containing protein
MHDRSQEMAFALDVVEGVLAALPVGFAFLDTELRYVRINQALATIQRLPIEAHLGRTPLEVFGERAREAEALLRDVLATGEPHHGVRWTIARPGEEVSHYLSSCYPVRGTSGALLGVGIAVADVTLTFATLVRLTVPPPVASVLPFRSRRRSQVQILLSSTPRQSRRGSARTRTPITVEERVR